MRKCELVSLPRYKHSGQRAVFCSVPLELGFYMAGRNALVGEAAYLGLSPGTGCVTLSDSLGFCESQPCLSPRRNRLSSQEILCLWVLLSPRPPLPALNDFTAQECGANTPGTGCSKKFKATESSCDCPGVPHCLPRTLLAPSSPIHSDGGREAGWVKDPWLLGCCIAQAGKGTPLLEPKVPPQLETRRAHICEMEGCL